MNMSYLMDWITVGAVVGDDSIDSKWAVKNNSREKQTLNGSSCEYQ